MGKRFKVQNLKPFALNCLLCTAIGLSGCVIAADFEALRGDVNQLRRETLELKKESSEVRRDVDDLKEKTTNVIKEDALFAFRDSQTDVHSRVLEISKDLQMLTGRFDENKYSMEKALKDSASEMEILNAQITNIESQIKEIQDKVNSLEEQTRQQKKPLEEQGTPQKTTESKDKVVMYEAAYNAFQQKQFKEAREKFESFLKEFPQDELADNAHFWMGEIYYNEKDFESAILAYETVLKKYPDSEKVPSALLKQGFSFIEIGDKKTGRTILEKLRESYPDSKQAEEAKKKIEQIGKETSKKKR